MRSLGALLLSTLALSASAQSLCTKIQALTELPSVSSAHWGVSVTRLDGTVLCQNNAAQLFRPASNNKIFTTATALALLGSDFRFTTEVTGAFDPATGAVRGDLTLVGAGDPNLDSNDLPYLPPSRRPEHPATFAFHDLDDLAAQLARTGVKTVTGDTVGDDTLFSRDPYPPSWNADDLLWGYGAPVSALTLADNQLPLTVTPGSGPGEPASVMLDQHGIRYLTLLADVRTGPAKEPPTLTIERQPGSRTLRIYGTVAAGAAPDHEEIAIEEPALFAAMAFRQALLQHGITVLGVARAAHRTPQAGSPSRTGVHQAAIPGAAEGAEPCSGPSPRDTPVLASHVSAPLIDDTLLTNKVSQNLHAELQLRALGRMACGDGSSASGVAAVRAYLLQAGVQPEDFLLYDGSGLSDHDLVAPRALTTFLRFAAAQPWFEAWKKTLPDSSISGSLASRFPALKGRIFAKTGTLGESRALSGYAVTGTGEVRVFSVLVDLHLPGGADREVMDRIVAALAE